MYSGTYMTDKTKQHGMAQWGPSACTRPDGVEVGELTKEMIADIVKAYGHVAGLAKRAGFEMLMIHGGHGWLINQFFSPYFNKRTDEYGGCLENRCRFAIEVLKAVREAVGPRFPIEFRMSGSELFEGGYDLEEGCRIAQQIEPYIDLLHVSAGTYQRGFGDTHPSMFKEHGCNVYLAAEIKKHVKVPVATIGGLNDPAQMEEIIASGKADIVYMARALLADPFLPNKVMANRGDEIVRLPALLHLHGGTRRHLYPPLHREPPHRPGAGGRHHLPRPRKEKGPRRGRRPRRSVCRLHGSPPRPSGHSLREGRRAGRHPEKRAGPALQTGDVPAGRHLRQPGP